MSARELLVGSYVRRDGIPVRVARLAGTHTYVVDVDRVRIAGTFTRRAAMAHVNQKGN